MPFLRLLHYSPTVSCMTYCTLYHGCTSITLIRHLLQYNITECLCRNHLSRWITSSVDMAFPSRYLLKPITRAMQLQLYYVTKCWHLSLSLVLLLTYCWTHLSLTPADDIAVFLHRIPVSVCVSRTTFREAMKTVVTWRSNFMIPTTRCRLTSGARMVTFVAYGRRPEYNWILANRFRYMQCVDCNLLTNSNYFLAWILHEIAHAGTL